ncbi:MAG: hypothetical protein MZV65_19500 [Chromatiales bacterium]|nr:hypothetical protein [Chromatiales bacterium]
MVKVHVWMPHGPNVGHTALTINNVYVSFWPDGQASKKDLKIKTSQPGVFMSELADDIRNEGNRHPITVSINGLNEAEILKYIKEIQLNAPRYQLAKHNCSHVVAQCLIAGAPRKPSFVPDAGAYSKLGRVLGRGIWTPDQVLRFARELV